MSLFAALSFISLGCDNLPPGTLVVASSLSEPQRTLIEQSWRTTSGQNAEINWVELSPGVDPSRALARRGGVDLLLGVSPTDLLSLSASGRLASVARIPILNEPETQPASMIDPLNFASMSQILADEGWDVGYDRIIRQALAGRLRVAQPDQPKKDKPAPSPVWVAVVAGSKQETAATQLIKQLGGTAAQATLDISSRDQVAVESLLLDILTASTISASRELRDAGLALDDNRHPARAEGSLSERPPWPPASVVRIKGQPGGDALLETLLEQVTPEGPGRDWLRESWSRPKRQIDSKILLEIARADDGRLVREPRFRSWLRGEWTAWTRQLYRRVARLAGGYVPS